jgi:hypothetical protein
MDGLAVEFDRVLFREGLLAVVTLRIGLAIPAAE